MWNEVKAPTAAVPEPLRLKARVEETHKPQVAERVILGQLQHQAIIPEMPLQQQARSQAIATQEIPL